MIAVVVVTRNRMRLLQRCVGAVLGQTRPPGLVVVVDNASADAAPTLFQEGPFAADPRIDFLRLPDNSGGAGGFHAGMARALARGAQWVWVMDDDACPDADALAALLSVDPRPDAIYGAAVLADEGDMGELVWPVQPLDGGSPGQTALRTADLPWLPVSVANVPFLGLLLHCELIERIGLPDAGFFLSGDDAEFCVRARGSGFRGPRRGNSPSFRSPSLSAHRCSRCLCTVARFVAPLLRRAQSSHHRPPLLWSAFFGPRPCLVRCCVGSLP